jgi:hypothetical protein
VVFQMESRGLLRGGNVLLVLGVSCQTHFLRIRAIHFSSRMDMCYWMLSWSSQVLGAFCAGNLCTRDISRV